MSPFITSVSRASLLASAFVCGGCGLAPGNAGEDTTTSSTSTGMTGASGNGSGAVTGTQDPTPCASSDDCDSGYCAAPYDAGAQPPVGEAVCVPECVPANALDRACTDDTSCCDALVCDAKALCVELDPGTTDTGTTDTGTTDTGTTGN